MLELQPLQAIRYNFETFGGDLSDVLAPPYDVLDDADKQALLARSRRNIVAIDLPHLPPKSAGPPEVYQQASRTLRQWIDEGTLVRDSRPALYVYHQAFKQEGRSHVRRMFFACLRLEPFERGIILPHEQTFGGPKEDRLALMKATECQLSPIFGLYADPGNRIGTALQAGLDQEPMATGTLNDVENRVWRVTDRSVIEQVAAAMADKKVYIADGHHRYGTALMYRDWCAERRGGSLPTDHPANLVMFVLASMDDPGCLILPYYRAIGGVTLAELVEAWSAGVEVLDGDESQGDLTLCEGATGLRVVLRYSRRSILRSLEPRQVEPWFALDYAYLHRYLIDELLTRARGAEPKLHYVKSAEDAVAAAASHRGVALLTKATPMAHLRAMSEAGGLMPQKSTYFHPKLATGVVIHPLT